MTPDGAWGLEDLILGAAGSGSARWLILALASLLIMVLLRLMVLERRKR